MIAKYEDIVYTDPKHGETHLRRHLTVPYCQGNGVDLGSAGLPVVPWAIQVDHPDNNYDQLIKQSIHLTIDAIELPFKNETLDFVYASHLLEDFLYWEPILTEWNRVIKIGGHIVLMVPDHERFRECVRNGQSDNMAHKHESYPGELTKYYACMFNNFTVIEDYITDGYNILFVAKKTAK